MKIALMPNMTRQNTLAVVAALTEKLDELGADWYCGRELNDICPGKYTDRIKNGDELFTGADVIITAGGDGSVIRAVKQSLVTGGSVLGVNSGNLAYLCELNPDELGLLSGLVSGHYRIQKRMMLETAVINNGKEIFRGTGINDIVFRRDAEANLIGLNVSANGRKIADYYADGVIFATPTGSSAYSLSAGGAIIEPTLDAALVTPICPHSLIIRPYVFRADTVFTVKPDDGNVHTVLSVDGGPSVALTPECTVTIKKSNEYAGFVSLKSNLFIEVLNKKLG